MLDLAFKFCGYTSWLTGAVLQNTYVFRRMDNYLYIYICICIFLSVCMNCLSRCSVLPALTPKKAVGLSIRRIPVQSFRSDSIGGYR